jgi:hypothetical protein
MHVFGYEGGGFHVAEGLWPVLAAAGLGALSLLAMTVLVFADPHPRQRPHSVRGLLACTGVLLGIALALFAYADHRYRDCLGDHFEPEGICERVVVGDGLVEPDR